MGFPRVLGLLGPKEGLGIGGKGFGGVGVGACVSHLKREKKGGREKGDRGYARISRVKKESGIWNVVGANIAASV